MALILYVAPYANSQSRKENLFKQATKTPVIFAWSVDPYCWLSDHQFLYWRETRQGLGLDGRKLYLYDTRTQKETFLAALDQALHKADFSAKPPSLHVSPDGTRLLWSEWANTALYGAWLAGSHYFKWVPQLDPNLGLLLNVFWTSDSRHWSED